jgi:alpha-ketoglutarate-dependent taurine dioxygenase
MARLVADRLDAGPGFVVARGWRVRPPHEERFTRLFKELGRLLGTLRPQDETSEVLHVVTDAGRAIPQQRGSKNNLPVRLHTENDGEPYPPRLVAMLCLEAAQEGGESLFASGHLVHNRVLESSTHLLRRLYGDFQFGRRPERYEGTVRADVDQVFKRRPGGVDVRYSRFWIDRGIELTGSTLEPDALAALDAVDETLLGNDVTARMLLRPGDFVVLDNRVVLHGRTKFTDPSDSPARRRMVRLWVD